MAGKGILLDDNFNIIVHDKAVLIGSSEMQEVAIILGLTQGDQKFSPVLGPNLIQLKKTTKSHFDIEQRVRVHLAKDGKDYQLIKNKLTTSF